MRKQYGRMMSAVVVAAGLLLVGRTLAGSLDPTNAPGPTMHTLEEIYQKQVDTEQKVGALVSPQTLSATTAVVNTGYYAATNLTQVDMDLATGNIKAGVTIFGVDGKTEVVDTTSGDAVAGDMLAGKKAWADGTEVTGNIATRTLSAANATVAVGYYEATTLTSVDADLTAGNIKSGTTIFGVPGASAVVDTSTGNAVAGDMLASKTAYANGALITGNVSAGANLSGADGSLVITITNGLYSGSKTATASDTDLVTGNIRSGVNMFGVDGKTEVVDTSSGDAAAGDMLAGKKAYVGGLEVTGVVATVTLSATTTVVNAGYYVATTLTAVDGDLAADNIRTNVTIFGVVGTLSTSSGGSTYAAPVPKTGQTTVYQTGDDGSYQKGVALPTPRFTVQANPDCVTDNLTGLIWARNANLGSYMNWSNAIVYCEALTYGGETDWRLPNVEEIQSLIAWRYSFPALCNTAGTGQWTANDPFTGVQASYYCSSSTYANTIDVWYVGMHTGVVDIFSKTTEYYVWPVRGGQ